MSKLITKFTEAENLSLLQLMKLTDNWCGLDITGEDWDWGVAYCLTEGKINSTADTDWFDRCMGLIAMNIKVIKYQPDWYTITDIETFVWENREIFEQFFNDYNGVGNRPLDYPELDPNRDTGFYEAYIQPLEWLISGDYSDEAYEQLYLALQEKAEAQ